MISVQFVKNTNRLQPVSHFLITRNEQLWAIITFDTDGIGFADS
jgi:hypothetical protein